MAHIQFTDNLVREYLISRGFITALKSFDSDVKASKDNSFRVDKIMDILMSSIHNLDLENLRTMWSHLDQHIFIHLESHQMIASRELGIDLLRRYVVQAASTPDQQSAAGRRNRDKVTEFFDKMAPEIHSRHEWRDWFALPFLKTPEDHPTFAVFFSRQWQDTLTVSLHNFLSIVFQCMSPPTLAKYQEDSALLLQLQRENMDLRSRLEALTGAAEPPPPEPPAVQPLMDDFSVVAHETPAADNSSSSKFRSLMRSIGSTSPGSRRRSPGNRPAAGPSGLLLATCDMDGAVRVWAPAPPPKQVCTMKARSPVLSCCWLSAHLLAYGTATGDVKIYDVVKRRQLMELGGDALAGAQDKRVLYSLTGAQPVHFPCCARWPSRAGSGSPRSDLLIYDLKASKEERHIYTLGADNKFVTWSLAQTGSQLAEWPLHERASGPFVLSRPAAGGEPVQQRPYGQLFALDHRQHLLTCGSTGGRLYKLSGAALEPAASPGAAALEPVLSLGGHVTSVLTCDMADNMCVTASLDGVVKTSSLLLHG
ncbi:WD repeat-containing protein 91-like [Pollicipes pollicipes]|uniref:WD repeat-containing protein 91-like n=1 Tax=Pollicipes pollicipes TaxID=41117 RepID=UPI0018852269|nr:WD repeat-containing protein 91-like [Pollicipes pollicipes]